MTNTPRVIIALYAHVSGKSRTTSIASLLTTEQTRKAQCHYSYMKPPRKRKQRSEEMDSPVTSESHHLVKRPALASPEPAAISPSVPQETLSNKVCSLVCCYYDSSLTLRKTSARQLPTSNIAPSSLYVDHLLASRQTPARGRDEEVVNKVGHFLYCAGIKLSNLDGYPASRDLWLVSLCATNFPG